MSKSDFKIGIVGHGFLGSSLLFGFSPCLKQENIMVHDKYKDGFRTLEDTTLNSDIIFMCLPTPAFKDNGEVDLSALTENLDKMNNMVSASDDKIVVIKSTVPPGTTDGFAEKYTNLRFVMNPEFLTGAQAKNDFLNTFRIILGGPDEDVARVESLYRARFGKSVLIFNTERRSAELVKYMCNLYFTTKVTFMNMMYDVCEKMDIEYDDVRDMFFSDGRVGRSHMQVPGGDLGEDGNPLRGFGNLCFPKDLKSFIFFMDGMGMDSKLLQEVWDRNLTYRPNKDWEKIPGAFSDR